MTKISKKYKPTKKEKFMNAKMKEYFRQKLNNWIEKFKYDIDYNKLILVSDSFLPFKDNIDTANKYNIDCLVEIHKFDEIDFALKLNNPIIGINNRNLSNLNINLDNTKDLRKQIPENFTLIAERGINTKQDIIEYNKTGIYNFLIGESLLKSKDISKKIKELI